MSNKRLLKTTSPEQIENISKKHLSSRNMSENNNQDVFCWNKLCNLLDEKLKDVAKKDDLTNITTEIEKLKQENTKLKEDINKLNSRLENIDRKTRMANIVVSGLDCSTTMAARNKFYKICQNDLNVDVTITHTRMLSLGKSFIFTMETFNQCQKVLAAKAKLTGQNIFIHKDYTDSEQNVRYNLRQLSKTVTKVRKDAKVRLGEFCIFINDKHYGWTNGKILAHSEIDAKFLGDILDETESTFELTTRNKMNYSNISNSNKNNQ